MLRWDRQKRHCRASHIERQIPYKQLISFHLNIIVISRQYSFLWCVICQYRFIVQRTMPTEIVENTRKTSLVEHRARRPLEQHSRTYLKPVTCWFSYSCDRFTLWQMQNQTWVFVSGWKIEENSQITVSKIYAESTWTWKRDFLSCLMIKYKDLQ